MKDRLKRLINFIIDNKIYFITFIVTSLIICVLYISNNVTPFGKKSLLCVDFYHQYGPMLGEFYDRIRNGGNLLYSFTMSMGLPFFRNYLNYMSSPFNLIIFLFSRNNLVTSYSFIIGLKAVMSSCTFVYYISHKFETKDLKIVPLGIIYGFSAFYSAYYWNIMWLDGMVFLPLITLGIEYIVKEGKWKFYTIFLSIMLISNYFIGYMVCIFSVLYFIVFNLHELKLEKGKYKKEIIKFIKNCLIFALGSITAGLLASILLVPLAYSLKSISATGSEFPKVQYYLFTLEDFLKYHLSSIPTTTFASDSIHAPNISTGILSVALLFTFIGNMHIPHKTKIAYLFLLGFFIVAFFDPKLDFILHAFHVPNDLPYRYSFLYVFIFATIASYGLLNINKIRYPVVLTGYVFFMVLLLLIRGDNWEGLTKNIIYINMILLTLYFIFYSGKKFISELKTPFVIALIITASIDVVASISHNWDITQVLATFYEDYDKTEELLQYVKDYDGTPFYRIENTQMMTYNDPSWYSYNGITAFSSMTYESLAKLQKNLGLPGNNINSFAYLQTTPIYDLMFDVKYFIGDTNDVNRYVPIKTIDETANEFKYNVGLGYAIKDNLETWNYRSYNPFSIQNEYIELATGEEEVLEEMKPDFVEELQNDNIYIVRYKFKNPNDNMYFYTDHYDISFFIIGTCLYNVDDGYASYTLNEDIIYNYVDDYKEKKVINIKSGDEYVYVDIAFNTNASPYEPFYMYTINQDKFDRAYKYLNDNKLIITDFKESYIKGYISSNDTFVYTSIPYDQGWNVYVDGEKVQTKIIGESLLGFDITPGNHTVEFKYRPVGMIKGILGTIIGIIILFSNKIYKKIRKILGNKKHNTKK